MLIEYGKIRAEIEEWHTPTEDIFYRWKEEFLTLEETRYFDIFLLGGFLEKLLQKRESATDIDILLTGCGDIEKIEKLIIAGTQLGLSNYGVFFDVLWTEQVPVFANKEETLRIRTYLPSNQWIVDGEACKTYHHAEPLKNSLWQMFRNFPTRKVHRQLVQGYQFSSPLLISARSCHDENS